ncbi:hypothetical protein [Methylomonas sp. AM2-LC]|uniref:hypothetical protein n=1 Tax=Methylomonas sp. AM2-LC TaxID=3153301 RepID=UPI0032670883
MDFKFSKTVMLAMGLILANNANADTYHFSETISGATITGSFTGTTTDGNSITNLSNISVFDNGVAFNGNGNLLAYSFQSTSPTTTAPTLGGAVVTINGFGNNFVFLDKDYYSTWTNELSGGNDGTAKNTYNLIAFPRDNLHFNNTAPENWSVTDVTSPVPESAEWVMMLLGLPMIGWVVRRKTGLGR